MKRLQTLDGRSRALVTGAGFSAIAAIGFVDYLTGPELGFSIFYLVPIALIAWTSRTTTALTASIVSAGFWLWADLFSLHAYSHPAIPYWNALVRLGVFAAFAVTLRYLRKSEERRDELLSFIVHDLRAPLTNVITGISLLRERFEADSREPEAEFLDLCMASCRRMIGLTEAILGLSRFEAGRMPMQIGEADSGSVIEAALEEVALLAREKSLVLSTERRGDTLGVRADEAVTVRILVNLLANAIKFAPIGSAIRVDAAAAGDVVRFSVSDEGEGIPPEFAERIFDKYEQVSLTRAGAAGGTGLGLAFAREAVNAQGGRIWVDPEHARGTAIHFTLPQSTRE